MISAKDNSENKLDTNPIFALGSRLAIVRAEQMMTQTEFAQSIDLSQRAYHHYERGNRSMPPEKLILISEKYEIDLNWLLRGLGNAKLADGSHELIEFVSSLHAYLDRTKTNLKTEQFNAIVSRWYNSWREGNKKGIDDVHIWIDFLRMQA